MHNFPGASTDNIPGLQLFYYVPVRDVVKIGRPEENVVKEIELKPDKKFYTGYSTIKRLKYTEPVERGSMGVGYNCKLEGFVPKDRLETLALFEEMEDDKFIVVYQDNNGLYKILGDVRTPFSFAANLDTGSDFGGENGHGYSFFRNCRHKAYFLEAEFETYDTTIDSRIFDDISIEFIFPEASLDSLEFEIQSSMQVGIFEFITFSGGALISYQFKLNNNPVNIPFQTSLGQFVKLEVEKADLGTEARVNIRGKIQI